MMWQLLADHEQKQGFGDVTVTQGLDAKRPITEALQLRSEWVSGSLGHHDSEVMDGERVSRSNAGALGILFTAGEGPDPAAVPAETDGGLRPWLAPPKRKVRVGHAAL